LAGIFTAVFAFRFLSYTGFPNDHFVYLARAQQILLGAWPARDFVDPGFLLMYVTSAAGLTLFGHNLLGEALIVFGGFAAAVALTYPLARAVAGSAIVAAGAVALQAFAYPRSYSYPKLFLHALAIMLCWNYLERPTTARRVGLAALVAVAFLFRPDHGVVLGVLALFAIVWADPRPLPERAKAAVRFAAVTAAFLLPWLVFVQSTAGFVSYMRSALAFTAIKAEVGRMGWPALQLGDLANEQNPEALLYYTFLLLPAAGALVLWRRGNVSAPMPDAAGRLWAVIILAVCTNATLLRNPLQNRLADVAVPQAILAAWLAAAAWRAIPGSTVGVRAGLRAAVALAVGLVTWSVLQLGGTLERFGHIGPLQPEALVGRAAVVARALRDIDTSLGVPTAAPLEPAPLIAYVKQCTAPTDRLMYIGYAPQMYFFARRGFAAGQVVFEGTYYTSPEEQALMLRRLQREEVPVVAIPDDNAAEVRSKLGAVAAYLDANYEHAGKIDLPGDQRGDLFLDRARSSKGVYAPFGWPCFAVAD
jgi:4-amino-4-deoxy-L-arabinose transferase-like glycosyltransferase